MGRRKNNNQSSSGGSISKMNQHNRFEDADEIIEDAAVSSNLENSVCEPDGSVDKAVEGSASEPDAVFIDADDKTSADYYFDSYSHFGNFSFARFPPGNLLDSNDLIKTYVLILDSKEL